ncbi:MAG: hypothetical protein QF441_00675 [Bacteriovoracaceae bacterium]|jgi:hypothetical protein|nr:hypothetical protein [Bacteriovoracaceae bacterium]
MDSYYFLEEELISKMHNSFTDRFNLDSSTAAELALEVLEIISLSNSNLTELNSLYFQ